MPEPTHNSILGNEPFREHARIVSLIIANWTAFESVATTWLAHVLGTDHMRAMMVWAEFVAVNQKLKLVRRAARTYLPQGATQDAIISILGDAFNLAHVRNRYAHAVYSTFTKPDGSAQLIISAWTSPAKDTVAIEPAMTLTIESLTADLQAMIGLLDRAAKVRLNPVTAPA